MALQHKQNLCTHKGVLLRTQISLFSLFVIQLKINKKWSNYLEVLINHSGSCYIAFVYVEILN